MAAYNQITVSNALSESVTVYDAYVDVPSDKSLANFFGTLTKIGEVPPGSSVTLGPIHGPISTYVVYDARNAPVKRFFTLGLAAQAFSVEQSDLDVIGATERFVALMASQPGNAIVERFQGLIKGGTGSPRDINLFFQGEPDYKDCTFISYMLVAVTMARTPATRTLPPEQQRYSLGSLLRSVGMDWPPALPDIAISQFHCSEGGGAIRLGGRLDVHDVTFAEGVLDHALGILPAASFDFTISIVTQPGLAVGTIRLACVFGALTIPVGDGRTIKFLYPTVTLSITPLFRFVTFEIVAVMPFSLFGGPQFSAIVAMAIDNAEAAVGVTLEGGGHTLLTPPGMSGLHFDQFGVGMGLFFTPPAFALGIEGKFHIGDGQQAVDLDDDTFVIVCAFEEGFPTPLYLSFNVPRLTLDRVLSIFTDRSMDVDVPVAFTHLSFCWAENIMEPVVLPDGSLAPAGYGFRSGMNVFGFGAYIDARVDLSVGLQGTAAMDPMSMGSVLRLTGDGPGVTIKVDADGKVMKNNVLPLSPAARDVIAHAATAPVVRPGGPQFHLDTSASPYLKLDATLAFLDFDGSISASVAKDGIHFALAFSALADGAMHCVLKNYHDFQGDFRYRAAWHIPVSDVAGHDLGSIQLSSDLFATLSLSTSTRNVVFTASAAVSLDGTEYRVGPVRLDARISAIDDVLSAIEQGLVDEARNVFRGLIHDAKAWSTAVYRNVIQPTARGAGGVIVVLKDAYGVGLGQMGDLLRGSPFQPGDVAGALRGAFGADVGGIARALVGAYHVGPDALCSALHVAAFSSQETASALSAVGFPLADAAKALQDVFHIGSGGMHDLLRSAGYPEQVIADKIPDIVNTLEKPAGEVKHVFGNIISGF